MDPFVATLERALACRGALDDRGLLAALLEAWRLVPDTDLAAAIDDVSLRFERAAMPDFTLTSNGLGREAWREVAARGRPEDVPWLVAAFFVANWIGPGEIDLLAKRPADPRIARALPQLRERRGWQAGLLDPLEAHVLAPAPVPDGARELHARVVGPMREAREAERALLEPIWADPGLDAPRLVYADWLLERGQPRGDFIALQYAAARDELDRGQKRRIPRLARRFRDDWLGGVAGALWPETVTFERGFLDSGYLRNVAERLVPAIGRPEWATVRLLKGHDPADVIVRLVTHPVMRSLRQLHDMLDDTILALAAHPAPLPLERLEVVMLRRASPAEEALLAAAEAFPRVRALRVGRRRETLSWLPGSAFAARLESLTVDCAAAQAASWLSDWSEGRFPALSELTLLLDEGGSLAVRSSALQAWGVEPAVLAGVLGGLPQGAVRAVSVEPKPPDRS